MAADDAPAARLTARVHGRVQGVGFRYATQRTARRLQLTGVVSNADDGTVVVIAEGPSETLDQLLEWLHRGPPSARVDEVSHRIGTSQQTYRSFGIE